MKVVKIDGNEINDISDFHFKIKEALELPDYYGENLDGLWDLLTGWIETPLIIEWKNYEKSRNVLGEFAEKALGVFKDAEKEVEGFRIICR